jgi:hypothetical protein
VAVLRRNLDLAKSSGKPKEVGRDAMVRLVALHLDSPNVAHARRGGRRDVRRCITLYRRPPAFPNSSIRPVVADDATAHRNRRSASAAAYRCEQGHQQQPASHVASPTPRDYIANYLRARAGRLATSEGWEDKRNVGERAVSHRAGDERFASGAVVRASMALTPALDESRQRRVSLITRLLSPGRSGSLPSGRRDDRRSSKASVR